MTKPLDDPDDVFRALSDACRRHVLYYLREHETASLDELAVVIAGWLTVDAGTVTTPKRKDRIRIALHHIHLPMLEESGLLTYHLESRCVELDDLSDEIEALLDRSLSIERARTNAGASETPSQEG